MIGHLYKKVLLLNDNFKFYTCGKLYVSSYRFGAVVKKEMEW